MSHSKKPAHHHCQNDAQEKVHAKCLCCICHICVVVPKLRGLGVVVWLLQKRDEADWGQSNCDQTFDCDSSHLPYIVCEFSSHKPFYLFLHAGRLTVPFWRWAATPVPRKTREAEWLDFDLEDASRVSNACSLGAPGKEQPLKLYPNVPQKEHFFDKFGGIEISWKIPQEGGDDTKTQSLSIWASKGQTAISPVSLWNTSLSATCLTRTGNMYIYMMYMFLFFHTDGSLHVKIAPAHTFNIPTFTWTTQS